MDRVVKLFAVLALILAVGIGTVSLPWSFGPSNAHAWGDAGDISDMGDIGESEGGSDSGGEAGDSGGECGE